MRSYWRDFRKAFHRVYPAAALYAQALAFNMFLTFFPLLLFLVSLLAHSRLGSIALLEMLSERWFLPPGTEQMLFQNLRGYDTHPLKWVFLGFIGTLVAGTQCMSALVESFRFMEHGSAPPSYWRQQLNSLLLLCLAVVPTLAAVLLTVFADFLRKWITWRFGLSRLLQIFWFWSAVGVAFFLVFIILALLYRAGQPSVEKWRFCFPGALVAAALWWVSNLCFGLYMRLMPYSPVYGGLAAVMGLLIWMQISAVVVLLGAAFNAERLASRKGISLSSVPDAPVKPVKPVAEIGSE